MKLVPYDLKKLENVGYYKKTKLLELLEEFVDSGMDCMKVEDYTHKHAASCASAFCQAAKRYGFNSVKVIQRGDDVFLIKSIKKD